MATVGNTYLTLKDKYAQTEGGKVTNTIIDLLAETNAVLEDAVVVECNNGTSHKTTVRNGLPTAEFRKFYQGVSPQKGTYTQVTDATGMLETYSEVDAALADLNGDKEQFLMNESSGFIEAMNQTACRNLFYGNKATNPAGFDGLANRYAKLSSDENSIGHYVVDAGGTGSDNTSIWFVTWGNLHTHLIYPKGSKAGLQFENKGKVTKQNADGTMFEVYRSHYTWDLGLSVRDFRSTCRICNIDVSDLGTNTTLIDKMVDAFGLIEDYAKTGKTVIYANRTVRTALHKMAMNKSNVHLTIDQFAGKPVVQFLGIPIKGCNAILNTEARVV